MLDAFLNSLSWLFLGTGVVPQPVPRATVVIYVELSGLGRINFSASDIVLSCLSGAE